MRNPLIVTLSALVGVLMVVSACSEEQRRDVEGAAIAVLIESRTDDLLDDNDIELEDDLDCSADIADDSTVSGSCTGTDVDGTAVETTLNGTVDVDEATCDATIVVTHGSETLLDESGYDCLDD